MSENRLGIDLGVTADMARQAHGRLLELCALYGHDRPVVLFGAKFCCRCGEPWADVAGVLDEDESVRHYENDQVLSRYLT